MNMVDFQEKMDPTHRMYLCRMLNVKELPEDLLERYAQVKKLVDRIDGHLTPGDLAMIIISVGNNPEIATELAETTDLNDMDLQAVKEAVEKNATPAEEPTMTGKQAEAAIASGAAKPVGTERELETVTAQDVGDDKEMEKILESPVSGATGQAQEKPTESSKLWSPGMPVRVMHEEEIKQGKIVGVSRPSEVGKQIGAAVKLTVEFEGGETASFDEDEVEAI